MVNCSNIFSLIESFNKILFVIIDKVQKTIAMFIIGNNKKTITMYVHQKSNAIIWYNWKPKTEILKIIFLNFWWKEKCILFNN